MGSCTLVLIMIISALCVAQALRCNYCKKINKEEPNCNEIEEIECSSGLDTCVRIRMHPPAYGEVRRCAKAKECDSVVPPQVERYCCSTDLCN